MDEELLKALREQTLALNSLMESVQTITGVLEALLLQLEGNVVDESNVPPEKYLDGTPHTGNPPA